MLQTSQGSQLHHAAEVTAQRAFPVGAPTAARSPSSYSLRGRRAASFSPGLSKQLTWHAVAAGSKPDQRPAQSMRDGLPASAHLANAKTASVARPVCRYLRVAALTLAFVLTGKSRRARAFQPRLSAISLITPGMSA